MEDVLEVYQRPYDGNEVLVCMDETSKQQVKETRVPRPAAPGLSAAYDYDITKPWEWATVEAAVKVALYRAVPRGRAGDEGIGPREPAQVLMTGKEPLDKILDGGLPLRSLTLVEGMSSTGKSVLCYHLAHRSLEDGRGVAYFVSDTPQALVARMAPLGMDVLAIHPIDVPTDTRPASERLPSQSTR